MSDLSVSNRLPDALVPSSYAEKAMASLLQLHSELMEEKERRVDLYRRLMEKEQANAELKLYVKMLEEKVEAATKAKPQAPAQVTQFVRSQPRAARPVERPVEASVAATSQALQASPIEVSKPTATATRPLPELAAAPVPGPSFAGRSASVGRSALRGASRAPAATKTQDGWKTW